jgi:hypothetical protein
VALNGTAAATTADDSPHAFYNWTTPKQQLPAFLLEKARNARVPPHIFVRTVDMHVNIIKNLITPANSTDGTTGTTATQDSTAG